jgi:hypothetical protein
MVSSTCDTWPTANCSNDAFAGSDVPHSGKIHFEEGTEPLQSIFIATHHQMLFKTMKA